MMKQLKGLTICNLEVLLMPNGEILCAGQSIGWFSKLKKFLTPKEPR